MDGHPVLRYLVEAAGTALIVMSMGDLFMTVFYARAGTGPMSQRVARFGWAVVRRVSRPLGRYKDVLLSFYGPGYLLLLLSLWLGLLLMGFTLLAWANLGTGIQSQTGNTPTDILTAFYYAGGSMTTVGSGDLRPVAPLFKVLTVIDSVD